MKRWSATSSCRPWKRPRSLRPGRRGCRWPHVRPLPEDEDGFKADKNRDCALVNGATRSSPICYGLIRSRRDDPIGGSYGAWAPRGPAGGGTCQLALDAAPSAGSDNLTRDRGRHPAVVDGVAMTKSSGSDSKNTLYCSFCGKSQHEVRKLIAGPTVSHLRRVRRALHGHHP